MRNRYGQPKLGICLNCGLIVKKILRVPLRQMKCPRCGLFTIVRKGLR